MMRQLEDGWEDQQRKRKRALEIEQAMWFGDFYSVLGTMRLLGRCAQ